MMIAIGEGAVRDGGDDDKARTQCLADTTLHNSA